MSRSEGRKGQLGGFGKIKEERTRKSSQRVQQQPRQQSQSGELEQLQKNLEEQGFRAVCRGTGVTRVSVRARDLVDQSKSTNK